MSAAESIRRFRCFGCSCGVVASGAGAKAASERARSTLLDLHERFSRFLPDSELSRLNRDRRGTVAISATMAQLLSAVREAGARTGGLVDGTLLAEIEQAGYRSDLGAPLPLDLALAIAPVRRPARASRFAGWREMEVDEHALLVRRPPGVAVDSGGIAKGLFADLVAEQLDHLEAYAVDCGGDVAIGGRAGSERPVHVASPFENATLHTFHVRWGGIATSGIGKRSWLGEDSRPRHHLLDPSSGKPAFTGVVQATALAPSALLAEAHAKAAVLSGPADAAAWLPWGGLIVLDDGSQIFVECDRAIPDAPATESLGRQLGSRRD